MTSRYRHRRSSNPATAFPAPLEPGEIAVNTANRQVAAGNVADGSPLDLIAVRFFDSHAIYKINDIVDFNGNLYRAAIANGPGAFNGANWVSNGTQVFFGDTVPPTALDGSFFWETDSGILYVRYNDGNSSQWVIASPQPDPSLFVARAGDTMGGPLTLAIDPTAAMMAATRQYVDAAAAAATAVAAGKVSKGGDTMSGALLAPVKGHTMGLAGGTVATGAVVPADASIKFYSIDANNWGGVGVDNNGTVWFRAGLSGTPIPLLTLGTDQIARFANSPLAPTPPAADSTTKAATTAFVANAMLAAAPLDASSFSGMQTNGNCEVLQVYGLLASNNLAGTTYNIPYADGWRLITSNAAANFNFNMGSKVPGGGLVSAPVSLFYTANNNLAAQASLANNDFFMFRHTIEGYRVARLMWGTALAMPLWYGFRFYSTIAGTLQVRFFNSAVVRVFNREHAIVPGWNWVSGTIPGDTTGTWLKDSGLGLYMDVVVAGKAAAPSAPNVWLTSAQQQTTGSTNFLGATGQTVEITGLVILPGLNGPDGVNAPLIMRPYSTELEVCKRYVYYKTYTAGAFWVFPIDPSGTVYRRYFLTFTPEMRIAPVITIAGATVGAFASGMPQVNNITTYGCQVLADATGTGAYSYITSLLLDARL